MTLDANTGLLILMGLDVVLAIVVAVAIIRARKRANDAFIKRQMGFAQRDRDWFEEAQRDPLYGEHTGDDRRPHDDLRSFTNPRR